MSEKETLKAALKDLLSDKETVREKAAKTIRETFSTRAAAAKFGKDGDARAWLVLFQSLFQAYKAQLKKCVSKLGSIHALDDSRDRSVVRLGDIAETIRDLTRTSRELLNARVLKALLRHLTDAIAPDGKFVGLISNTYAQTIEYLLAWKPHLRSLPDDMWHALMAISFNIVLGRVPRRTLEDNPGTEGSQDSYDSGEGSDDGQLSSSSLKRQRPGSQGPSNRQPRDVVTRPTRRTDLTHGQFMIIIAQLLRSPTAPVLSIPDEPTSQEGEQDPHRFPNALLNYFSHFLRIYIVDSSSRPDYLSALSAALGHYTLNCRQPVSAFTANSWEALVNMWDTKEKLDDMVIILRMLFPVLTAAAVGDEDSAIPVHALSTLWSVAERVTAKSSTEFGLNTLQLRIANFARQQAYTQHAFSAATFEHGWGLDKERALAWATLELQADCAEKLYLLTESTYSAITVGQKRIKLVNPIAVLLQSIRSQTPRDTRLRHLHILLFFVERHWRVLHEDLRKEIVGSLTSLVSFEDADIQSWTFICLAAIAHAESSLGGFGSSESRTNADTAALWDPVWTHAMRRANVPAVSRAACHAAHALLLHSKRLLSSQRVFGEIESFVKDLDVQGPAYPYDSVCGFMVLCLRFANQDARLYRMQMEEKVLSWLMEAWRIDSGLRRTMAMHTVAHIHSLLEAITGSPRRVALQCDIKLPPSRIVDAVVEETHTRVIRDFQLRAHLPPYEPSSSSSGTASLSNPVVLEEPVHRSLSPDVDIADLVPPRGRERRLSAFLLKSLEATCAGLPNLSKPPPETQRSALDLAVSALFFEASLLMNGTQANRRVIQAACRLVSIVTPSLIDIEEVEHLRLVLGALDPLTLVEDDDERGGSPWETLVPPGERTGIRTQILQKLLAVGRVNDGDTALRHRLQRCVFRSADVQDTFVELLRQLRAVLRKIMAKAATPNPLKPGLPFDDFSATTDTSGSVESVQKAVATAVHSKHIVEACVTALAVVPILQSSSGEPTHDNELLELVLTCEPSQFLLLAPPCLDHASRRRLHLSRSNMKALLEQIEYLCEDYVQKNNDEAQLLIVRTLEATSHLWREKFADDSEIGGKARFYCHQCVQLLKNRNRRSWRVQDAILRFLDRYLAMDPRQETWSIPEADDTVPEPEDLPAAVLPTFGNDTDIRIRFRVATTNARLFTVGRLAGRNAMDVYYDIRRHLSTSQEQFDRIITRLLCLGNIMISEGSVRRGAYWHLLEIAFYSNTYHRHLKAVLMGVTTRLGMERFSDLFNCYASQFAYSIRRSRIDIFRFPPDLIGYRDLRECAESTFSALTPTNLLAAGVSVEEVEFGRELYARHCQTLQKSEKDGIQECFADLVAYQITLWLEPHSQPDELAKAEAELMRVLKEKTRFVKRDDLFRDLFQRNVDQIIVAILRTLGDLDVSGNGPIVAALQQNSADDAASTFFSLTKYRVLDTFDTHQPNLPSFGTEIILRAINWYSSHVEHADSRAVTYHVLHHLFADIERSPLVNEQYRSLNALCLWIALHRDHFEDGSLLRVLIVRTVAVLAQADLVRSAQSLLEWSLSLYQAHMPKADHRLADVLIRTSTLAQDFSDIPGAPFLKKLGDELMAWVEAQAQSLRRSRSMRKQVNRALAAWPRELPPSIRSACDDLQLSDLTSALNERGISSSKFRLVRKIYDIASQGTSGSDERRFGSSDFWRLKACIPPDGYLVDSDIDAFTSLLILHHGRIDSLGNEQFAPESVCSRHRKAAAEHSREIVPHANVELARSATITSLLTMLDTVPAPQVHIAYSTLRSLMSTPSADTFPDAALPSDLRHELEYLRAFQKPQGKSSLPDLPTILVSEELAHLVSDFPGWITRVTTLLCDALGARDSFFSPLVPLLRSDHSFAEEMLPVLVHSLLQIEFDDLNPVRSIISRFFSSVLANADTATSCSRAIISAVLHLRSFHPSREPKDALAHEKWLSIDFVLLSRCAIKCGAYTTALLFLELAADYPSPESGGRASTEDILFEIYSHIDEPDGFYGIQTDDLRNLFVKRLRHENQWDKAFRYHGAVLESGAVGSSDRNGIVQALHSFGFNHLAMNTLQHFSDADNSLGSSALAYDLGWRAETWDLPEVLATDHSGATIYLAMRAVYRERNQHVVDGVVRRAFLREMNRLRELGTENFVEIRQVARNLMCLSQVRQWRGDKIQKGLQGGQNNEAGWRGFTSLEPDFDFIDVEAIMATRISLIRSIRQKEQREQIGDLLSPLCETLLDMEKSCLLCVSERARGADESQIALNSVVRAQNLERNPSADVTREFSNVLWLLKEPKLAIKSLSALIASSDEDMDLDDVPSRLRRGSLLAQLGTWSAEASMKKPSQIVSDYFAPAANIILRSDVQSATGVDHSAASIFHQYAIFAEHQYNAITKSPDTLRWKLYVDRKTEEIKQRAHQLKKMQTHTRDYQVLARQQEQAEKVLKEDRERMQEHLNQRNSFLSLAVEMYSRCLSASDSFDEDSPIRLCSLWLANFDNDDTTLRFEGALDRVPSRKFVFLAHQLTARLWSSEQGTPSRNQVILQGIIQRMCREHPFHSLFPLYCIRVDRSASSQSSTSRRQSGRHASQPGSSQLERGAAAADIFDKLRCDDSSAERIRAVELVCDASLQLAKYPIKAQYNKMNPRPKSFNVPEELLIRKIKDIKVPVITAHTPIDPTTRYEECAWITRYDTHFSPAGGVNMPKIMRCLGSDGKHYKQLYKGEGNDDLRQDAVMEQVFDLVNVVLRRDRETKRRKLSVRDYQVIPLASQAGVLEFVENTTPLANWLKPAHWRYGPRDLSQDQINKYITGSQPQEWKNSPEKVIERFLQIREQHKPVMRHFFTEKHKTPMAWYTMRLHYQRSVATNSIVGHILGLGDRHTSNILIDNKTGEVVHVDLGIAFEQGKLLPQPERVPFRLTADMIDGLGISGTQGVFQRCAEETLRVLRDGSEIILTVLEVFKYDPLHSWTASELKIKRVQSAAPDETAQITGEALRFAIGIDMAGGAADEAADRALSAVARKLDKTLSVEYTVNELITEASDPGNLALMYIGWTPYW